MSETEKLNWARAYRTLTYFRERLERSSIVSEEQRDAIFRHRANLLARPEAAPDEAAREEIIVIRAGTSRYGIPLSRVTEVLPDERRAALPGVPAEVAGLIQVRGEIRLVWYLGGLLGAGAGENQSAGSIVLLRYGSREVGLQVDEVEDIRAISDEERLPAPHGAAHVEWMTADLVAVLDTDLLLTNKLQGL